MASPGVEVEGPLVIDGKPVTQITVPAPGLDIVYATAGDALYRRGGGQDWTKVSEGGNGGRILADPTRPDLLYRGDHAPCARGGDPIVLEKSIDGGLTWEKIPSGKDVRPLVADPLNSLRLFGDNCQLAVSIDGGETWTSSAPVAGFDVTDLALVGTQLYGIFTSEGGTSRLIPLDVSNPTSPVTGPALLEFWGSGVLFATLDRMIVGESYGIHISVDDGQTWTFSREGLEDVTLSVNALVQPIPQEEMSQGFGIFSLAVDPRKLERIYAGTIRGLYVSEDSGETWSPVAEIPEVEVSSVAFARGGSLLYVMTDEGAYVLTIP